MVEIYSVEAVLGIRDASFLNGLRAAAKELRTIESQLVKVRAASSAMGASPIFATAGLGQAQKMRAAMAGIATEAARANAALRALEVSPQAIAGAGRLTRSLGTATTRAAALKAELAGLRLPGGMLPPRGPGGPGGHGRSPFSGRYHAGPVATHFGLGPAEIGAIVLGGGMFEGTKNAAEEQRSLLAAVLASGVLPSSPAGQIEYNDLRGIVERISQGSIFNPAVVAKALPNILGLSDVPYAQAKPLLLPATRFAESANIIGSSQGKNVGIEESASALIRTAHNLGVLDPDRMDKIGRMMLVAQQTAGVTPGNLEKNLSYFAGTARMMGMSPEQAVQLGAISSLGIPGTRSGTSLNQLLLGLLPAGGPGSGTKMHLGAKFRGTELERMHLLDPKTHKILSDPISLLTGLAKFRQEHPEEAVEAFKRMFNTRGMRAAEWLSFAGVLDKFLEIQERMKNAPDALGFQREFLGPGLIPQLQYSWANLQGVLNILASGTLPTLTAGFSKLNDGLDWLRKNLTDKDGNPTGTATAIGYGGEAGATLLAGWTMYKLLRRVGSFLNGPKAAAAAPGAIGGEEAAVAAAAAGGWGLPALGATAVGGALYAAYKGHQYLLNQDEMYKRHGMEATFTEPLSGDPMAWDYPSARRGTAERRAVEAVNLTGNVTLNGDVHLSMGDLGAIIAKAVAKGIMHATTGGTVGSTGAPDPTGSYPIPSAVY